MSTEKSLAKSTKELLTPYVEKGAIAGAVALASSRERTLSLESVGFAGLKSRAPMAEDALFWIASMTKPMTATVFMTLVDEGKVSLDDPVEKHLDFFKTQMLTVEKSESGAVLKKPSRPITLRDVLSHVSGLPFASPIEGPYDALPLKFATKSYAVCDLQSEPGEKYAYSNAGINTAARVCEVVSGMAFEELLQERLLKPLGMKDTGFWPSGRKLARVAKSVKTNPKSGKLEEIQIDQLSYPLNDRKSRFALPAGGLFSTAEDVGKFCRMILNGGVHGKKRLVSEKSLKEMTSRQTKPSLAAYGLGWGLDEKREGFGHGGAYNTSLQIFPKEGLATVFMTQICGQGDFGGEAFIDWARAKFGER